MNPKLTHTQLRRSINDLRNEIIIMRRQINELMDFAPSRIKQIVDTVEKAYGLPEGSLYTKSRKGHVPEARKVAITIIRKTTNAGVQDVARMFNQHHSSVTHAVEHITQLYKLYNGVRHQVDGICEDLCVKIEL